MTICSCQSLFILHISEVTIFSTAPLNLSFTNNTHFCINSFGIKDSSRVHTKEGHSKCVATLDWDSFWSLLVTVSSTIVVFLNEEVATFGWKARLQSSQQVPAGCVHCIPSSWHERRNFTGSKLAFLVFPVLETSASSHSTRNKTGQYSRENTDWDQRLEQKVLLLKQCL